MEDWQNKVIKTNIDKLISSTVCNVTLLATLQASGVLSEEEVEELNGLGSKRAAQSHRLYSILPTRVNAYATLLKGLESTNQSGALRILVGDTEDFKVTIDEKSVLGKGSNGTVVYKGTFGKLDVAVKRIHIIDTDMMDCTEAVHEINVLKSCDKHENIVRYFGSKKTDKRFLILLEICKMTLSRWVVEKSIEIPSIEVLKQTTVGLSWLHEHRIVHRDLKPDNILFTRNPTRIKIPDFGLSRKIKDGRSSVSTTSICGTSGWVAPEILRELQKENFLSCKFNMVATTTGKEQLVRNVFLIPTSKLDDQKFEFIFVLDVSGSMSGQPIELAKRTLLLFLHSLPEDCCFNVITFRCSFNSFFPLSVRYSQKTLNIAKQNIAEIYGCGGTELFPLLQHICSRSQIDGYLTQIFTITDGRVKNCDAVLSLVASNVKHSRSFSLGIGHGVDKNLVIGIAENAGGMYEFVTYNETFESKILIQLKTAVKPALLKPIRVQSESRLILMLAEE